MTPLEMYAWLFLGYLVVGLFFTVMATLYPGPNRPRTCEQFQAVMFVSLLFWLPVTIWFLSSKLLTGHYPHFGEGQR